MIFYLTKQTNISVINKTKLFIKNLNHALLQERCKENSKVSQSLTPQFVLTDVCLYQQF